jgi:hypothetical protein
MKDELYQAVKEIDNDRIWDAAYQRDVRDFLFREDVDPVRFADSLSEENMPYLQYFIVSRMKNDLKKVSRQARNVEDGESTKRIEELRAKIVELGGTVDDDDW